MTDPLQLGFSHEALFAMHAVPDPSGPRRPARVDVLPYLTTVKQEYDWGVR